MSGTNGSLEGYKHVKIRAANTKVPPAATAVVKAQNASLENRYCLPMHFTALQFVTICEWWNRIGGACQSVFSRKKNKD